VTADPETRATATGTGSPPGAPAAEAAPAASAPPQTPPATAAAVGYLGRSGDLSTALLLPAVAVALTAAAAPVTRLPAGNG
jgi:hypothetical protein